MGIPPRLDVAFELRARNARQRQLFFFAERQELKIPRQQGFLFGGTIAADRRRCLRR